MQQQKNLHFRRFEFKYHLPRDLADVIVPNMLKYMVWDEFSKNDEGYIVNSLYLDSPGYNSYFEKIDGIMNRKKLRIRSYAENFSFEEDAFLEIKRKSGNVILKDRIDVEAKKLQAFMSDPFSLASDKNLDADFVNEFLFDIASESMKPAVFVKYLRKPFFSKFDRSFRVTFDYDMSFAPFEGIDNPFFCEKFAHDLVAMEVKFSGALPGWFYDIIQKYSLSRDVFSKYCGAMEAFKGGSFFS